MELIKFITKLKREGKTEDEINFEISKSFPQLEVKEIVEALKAAQKAVDIESQVKTEEAKAAQKAEIIATTKEIVNQQVEEELSKIKNAGNPFGSQPQIKENPEQWKLELAESFKLMVKVQAKTATASEQDEYREQRNKTLNRWAEVHGEKTIDAVITGTDASGGFFMAPQFDAEVDKIVYDSSELLSAIKMRPGTEKTEINSISTFDFAYRSNENAAFGATKPTFAQQEHKYRDAGTLVYVANRALQGSYYNLVAELMELAADAKIRLLEPLLTTGSTADSPTAAPFNGIRFHTGVTTLDCKNSGGSGRLETTDLTRLFLAAPSQTRKQGLFIMDSREAMLLAEEKDSNGRPLELVKMVNGSYIHMPTGKQIIIVDTMSRTCSGVTDSQNGTDVPVLFGVLDRFRYYSLGGLRVDTSKDFSFDTDSMTMRFVMSNKWGIPAQSRSSFVTLQGVKSNAVA